MQNFSLSRFSYNHDSEDEVSESQNFINHESRVKSSNQRSHFMSTRWIIVTNAALFASSVAILLLVLHMHSWKAAAGGSGLLSCE